MSQLRDTLTAILGSMQGDEWHEGPLIEKVERVFGMDIEDEDLLLLEDVGRVELGLAIADGYCMDRALTRIFVSGVQIGRKLQGADELREML